MHDADKTFIITDANGHVINLGRLSETNDTPELEYIVLPDNTKKPWPKNKPFPDVATPYSGQELQGMQSSPLGLNQNIVYQNDLVSTYQYPGLSSTQTLSVGDTSPRDSTSSSVLITNLKPGTTKEYIMLQVGNLHLISAKSIWVDSTNGTATLKFFRPQFANLFIDLYNGNIWDEQKICVQWSNDDNIAPSHQQVISNF